MHAVQSRLNTRNSADWCLALAPSLALSSREFRARLGETGLTVARDLHATFTLAALGHVYTCDNEYRASRALCAVISNEHRDRQDHFAFFRPIRWFRDTTNERLQVGLHGFVVIRRTAGSLAEGNLIDRVDLRIFDTLMIREKRCLIPHVGF